MKLLVIFALVGVGYYYALTGMASMAVTQVQHFNQQYQAAADYADRASLATTQP